MPRENWDCCWAWTARRRSRLARVAGGHAVPTRGHALLFGEDASRSRASRDTRGRVARIPDDRHALGIVSDMALWENAILDTANRRRFARFGIVRRRNAKAFTEELIERFDIRCRGPDMPTGLLSGGNMQKLILGRVLSVRPRFIIANQPTRGLDIGAAAYVRECLLEAREGGAAVLVISEDLDETLTEELIERFDIRCRGPDMPTGLLSGGNMQKLILGRVLSVRPRFIIANQPTRGLDIGAAAYVRECLLEAREGGAAVLVISEDLDETLSIADRIVVVYRGRLSRPRPVGSLTKREIGLLMAGQWDEVDNAR